MAQKVVIVAMTGEVACFVHVLLNGIDMQNRGLEVKIVIEGKATGLLKELNNPDKPYAPLYAKVKAAGLIDCVCRACAPRQWVLLRMLRVKDCRYSTR